MSDDQLGGVWRDPEERERKAVIDDAERHGRVMEIAELMGRGGTWSAWLAGGDLPDDAVYLGSAWYGDEPGGEERGDSRWVEIALFEPPPKVHPGEARLVELLEAVEEDQPGCICQRLRVAEIQYPHTGERGWWGTRQYGHSDRDCPRAFEGVRSVQPEPVPDEH
jgi:hypothetical protein